MTLHFARLAIVLACVGCSAAAFAQEPKVAKVDSPAPADAVAPEIAALLQPTGISVAKGSRVILEFWPAKEWPMAADAKAAGDVNYPLTVGQVIGVVRYPRKGADFRDQEIPTGVYIARYAQQPVDGAHVGTAPSRDFLALLPAAKDREAKALDYKTLTNLSKETSGTAHPAVLFMPKGEGEGQASAREDSEKQWTILHFVGKTKQGATMVDLPVDLVVVGKAAE